MFEKVSPNKCLENIFNGETFFVARRSPKEAVQE
jgi:hypothetical protein